MRFGRLDFARLGPTVYALAAVLVILAILAPFLRVATLTFLISMFIYVALAYSINFITGLTGYVSFGHVVFLGIGAYALGYTSQAFHLAPLAGVVVGGAFGLIFAFAIGVVTLRFRGVYFAIASLVTVLAALNIVLVVQQLGAGQGITLNFGTFQPLQYFYTLWVIVGVAIALTYWVTHGRIGAGIRAIKSDEDAARAVGIDAARLKLYVFLLSGAFAGATGAVFAWENSGVFPNDIFDLTFSLLMLAMIVIGGMGTVSGPFLGGAVVYSSIYFFLTSFVGWEYVIIGVVVVLIAIVIPEGIVGSLRRYLPAVRRYIE